MAISSNELPEGTNSVIPDSSVADPIGDKRRFAGGTGYASNESFERVDAGGSDTADKAGEVAAKVGDATAGLRAQATDKVYGIAAQGKDRAVGLLDNVSQMVDDAAGQIDEKAGEQYGAYVRQASQAVSGLADGLRNKDVDDLVRDARELVRKSPAIAIGAAAAIGFVVARVLKVGLSEGADITTEKSDRSLAVTPTTATAFPADNVF